MNTLHFHLAAAALLLIAPLAPAASKPASAKPVPVRTAPTKPGKTDEGFKAFAIITERNVFNANRAADAAPAPVAAPAKAARPPRVEAFALLGTLLSERGAVAFFDGTNPAYRKAAEPGDQLGTHTVAAVEHDHVTLREGEREWSLPVKMQFRREDQGEWLLAELPDDFQPTAPSPGQAFTFRKPDSRALTPEQVRDYVMSRNQRKLELLAASPEKAEKFLKSLEKEIEGRLRKLEKDQEKAERKLQTPAP